MMRKHFYFTQTPAACDYCQQFIAYGNIVSLCLAVIAVCFSLIKLLKLFLPTTLIDCRPYCTVHNVCTLL